MLNLNEYGAWQAKMNGENQCFKGWETLVINILRHSLLCWSKGL